MSFSDAQIKYMRDRFLNWTLPYDLKPDGGISYRRSESAIKYNHPGPVGTNFLDATQAEAMVRHMVDGMPLELERQVESLYAEIEQWRNIKAGDIPDNDAWKDVIKYAYADGGDGALNIYSITSHYIAMRTEVESLRAELAASADVIKKTQDIYDDTVRECLELRGQLDAEKQRADALEASLKYLDQRHVYYAWIGDECIVCPYRGSSLTEALEAARKPVPQEPKA